MPLVRHVVNRVCAGPNSTRILDYEDLVAFGVQGLVEAYRAFDVDKGVRFSTYAMPRIRGAILDAIRAAHPLPRSLQRFASDYEKAVAALHADLERAPTNDEVATYLNMDVAEVLQSARLVRIHVTSLEQVADAQREHDPERRWEIADDDPRIDPENALEEAALRDGLRRAIMKLPDRERAILRMYYGQSQTLKALGERLGVSESRASQLHQRAIRHLRELLLDPGELAA
jgi:RNA polymerase sigma factor for flagellar operon FliA